MTSAPPENEIQVLLNAFAQQVNCYAAMLEISRQERDLIRAGFVASRWIGLLEKRQRLMEEVAGIEARIAPIKTKWHRACQQGQLPLEAEMRRWLDRIKKLLSELIQADEENQRLLGQHDRGPTLSLAGGAA